MNSFWVGRTLKTKLMKGCYPKIWIRLWVWISVLLEISLAAMHGAVKRGYCIS